MITPSRIGTIDAHKFLESHLGRKVEAVELVGEGAWSRCFGFSDRGREFVIRFGRFVEDFEKDLRAASFSSAALPVPEVTEIGQAFDGYFAISSRAHGEPLESLSSVGWKDVLPSLLAALDAARSIDLSDTTGYGFWDAYGNAHQASWRDFLLAVDTDTPARRTHGWRQRLIESPVGDQTFRAGLARLAELVDASPCERHLVHCDLINRNVLVSSGHITAVLDWGCSFYGDFLYDVAWLEFWAPWHPSIEATDIRTQLLLHYAAIGQDVPDFDSRLRSCMIHIGLDHQAYNAYTGNLDALTAVTERLLSLLE